MSVYKNGPEGLTSVSVYENGPEGLTSTADRTPHQGAPIFFLTNAKASVVDPWRELKTN